MVWISSIFLSFVALSAELPQFLTKHSLDTLRYISMDGRYAYVQKKPGVLGLVSSFRSVDFLSDTNQSNFLIKDSRFKQRLAIEAIPDAHLEYSLNKNHKIFVIDYGNSNPREIGQGRKARLHLKDEWISYFNAVEQILHLENLVTQKKYEIKLSRKPNPFFMPEVEMINSSTIMYTDINEAGYAAIISYNLTTQKSTIHYRSPQSATRIELCQQDQYIGIGEFPYDGVNRGSKIFSIKTTAGVNLAGFTTLYQSVEQDIGNMVCLPESIYFVKTMNQNKRLNYKVTEAVRLDLRSQKMTIKSDLKHVNQLIEMDGRVLLPLRGEFFVLEGTSNLGEDILKAVPGKEELNLDI